MHRTVDSLLDHHGVAHGDGSIVSYSSLGILTVCDMRVYPCEAARIIEVLWLAVHTPRTVPRKRFWNIPRSQLDSEVDVFCIESGDNLAVAYLDDVALTVSDVEFYEQHLQEAIRACT